MPLAVQLAVQLAVRLAMQLAVQLAWNPGGNALEKKLGKVTPQEFMHHAHHWLILHGRYVCKARKPDCLNCIVREECSFKEKAI